MREVRERYVCVCVCVCVFRVRPRGLSGVWVCGKQWLAICNRNADHIFHSAFMWGAFLLRGFFSSALFFSLLPLLHSFCPSSLTSGGGCAYSPRCQERTSHRQVRRSEGRRGDQQLHRETDRRLMPSPASLRYWRSQPAWR